MKPSHVTLWSNGNVMVFDEQGEQMPDLQQRGDRAVQRIMSVAGEETKFYFGVFRVGELPISKQEFAVLSKAPWDEMDCWQEAAG